MKVSNVGSSKSTSEAKKKKKADGGGGAEFAEALEKAAGSSESQGAVDTGGVGAVDSLLAVQASGDATEDQKRRRRQVVQYGEQLLDRLEEVRRGLLQGTIPKDRLADLAHSMRAQRQRTDDPKLQEIIDEIELRAEVEIAKLTRGG